jgi:transformation/transcription domain-associated protein
VDHRKDLIKFAWNHLKAEDATTKHWAYANVCRFISAYDTPPKIILQVLTE